MKDPDLVGQASLNGTPPFISIFLSVGDGFVKRATFQAQGCGVTTAACSVLTGHVVGKTIEECRLLTPEAICLQLEGVPPDKMHCVHVCLKALHNAFNDEPLAWDGQQ